MAGEAPAQSHSAARDLRAAGLDVRPWFLQAGPQVCCVSGETLFLLVLWAWDRFQHPPDDGLSENPLFFSLTRLDIPRNQLIFLSLGWTFPEEAFFCFPLFLKNRKIAKHPGTECSVSLEQAWVGCPGVTGSAVRSLPAPSPAGPPVTTWADTVAGSSVRGPKRGFPLRLRNEPDSSARRGCWWPWQTPSRARPWYLGA